MNSSHWVLMVSSEACPPVHKTDRLAWISVSFPSQVKRTYLQYMVHLEDLTDAQPATKCVISFLLVVEPIFPGKLWQRTFWLME